MPYTVGATHVLTGAGQVVVNQPIGLRVALSSIPGTSTELFSTPPRYFRIGRLTLGNDDGFLPAMFLHYVHSLFYPVPDSMTVLDYDLVGTTIAVVDELVGSVVVTASSPFGTVGAFGTGAFG